MAKEPVLRWIPLLCAYSGARLGEICHLREQDVREVDGIPTISFTLSGPLKNRRSMRTIPLHPIVLAAGFLTFVESRRSGVFVSRITPRPVWKAQLKWQQDHRSVGAQLGILLIHG